MPDATLKLHIEKPGTNYTHKDGAISPSAAGHVWMEVVYADGSSKQAGFAPENPKGGVSSVIGEVYRNDRDSYSGESHFTASYRVTENQAMNLERYFRDPSAYGFDKDHYNAATNSCVDFVWKGLKEIGMNPSGYQGDLVPMKNIDHFSTLKNPEIAGGGLVHTETLSDHTSGHDDQFSSPLNPMWSGTPNPWVNIIHVPDINHAPEPTGTVTVGPLSPPIPVEQDGSNYADGTSYQ